MRVGIEYIKHVTVNELYAEEHRCAVLGAEGEALLRIHIHNPVMTMYSKYIDSILVSPILLL